MPNYYPPATSAGGGGTPDDNSVTSAKIVDGAIVNADVNAAAAIAYSKLALTGSIVTGDITDGTILGGDLSSTIAIPSAATATTQAATDSSTKLASTAYVMLKEWAFILGKAGSIGATETDASDFFFIVPFDCTMLRMKAVVKSAVSGAMTVQLRAATTPTNSITWGNVSGFVCTYTGNGYFTASIDPANVNASEGDLLGFSCATGSGVDLMVEVVVVHR